EIPSGLERGPVQRARGEGIVDHQCATRARESGLRAALAADEEIGPEDEHQLAARQRRGSLVGGQFAHVRGQGPDHQLPVPAALGTPSWCSPQRTTSTGELPRSAGSVRTKRAPCPATLCTSTWPCSAWIWLRTTSRPTPRPENSVASVLVENPGRKISWWSCWVALFASCAVATS